MRDVRDTASRARWPPRGTMLLALGGAFLSFEFWKVADDDLCFSVPYRVISTSAGGWAPGAPHWCAQSVQDQTAALASGDELSMAWAFWASPAAAALSRAGVLS